MWVYSRYFLRATNKKVTRALLFKNTHEAGIATYALNMIGLPYETPEMIEENIKINKIVSPSSFQVSIFYPCPQTELWNLCKKNDFLTDEFRTSIMDDSILQLQTLSKKQ